MAGAIFCVVVSVLTALYRQQYAPAAFCAFGAVVCCHLFVDRRHELRRLRREAASTALSQPAPDNC